MPIILRIVMVIFTFMGAGFALVTALAPIIFLGNGPFAIDGASVSKAEFFRESSGFLFLLLPTAALYLGSIAYALIKERAWSRPLLMGYIPLAGLLLVSQLSGLRSQIASADLEFAVIEFAIVTLIAWWYLYRKRAVVTYYRALQGAKPPASS